MLCPEEFDNVIEAILKMCVLQNASKATQRPTYKTPSLALKIGHHLKKCVSIEIGICLRQKPCEKTSLKLKTLQNFQTLLEMEWATKISSNALASLYNKKLNTTELLRITEDLLKLNNYLEENIKRIIDSNPDVIDWMDFASMVLSRLILFNKRRSGEAARMKLLDYLNRPESHIHSEELRKSLSEVEKTLSERLSVVEIIGKRGRKVPVLLTKQMIQAIDFLNSKRNVAGVNRENEYVFAYSSSLKHIRGHDSLKKWSLKAQLSSPELVTSTKIRKYIATVCQLFDLTETEQDWLARHLGHDIRVHREFYRTHENAVETTKVGRMLMAVDQGRVHEFQGKKLSEINVTGKWSFKYLR